MQDDLIERLEAKERRFWVDDQQPAYPDSIFGEAAEAGKADNARIAALEADNARLNDRAMAWRDDAARLRGLFAQLSCDPDACAVSRQYARGALTDEDPATSVIAIELAGQVDELRADNARLMGLVKVLRPYLAVLTEKPQKANWTDRYCVARDQLEVVASAILAKIKEATDAPVK